MQPEKTQETQSEETSNLIYYMVLGTGRYMEYGLGWNSNCSWFGILDKSWDKK